MLVELDDILHTLDEHGRLPAAAVADMLDLHAFDVRIALLGAATWGLVRRDGRGAWMLTERGRAAVSSDAPVAARPRPLHRARRPVLAAWALVAVAVVAVLAASWVSHPAAPSAGSEFSAANGTTSRAFVGISGSRARRSRAKLVPRLGALRPQQSTTAGRLPAYRTHSGPRVAAVVPRAIAGARPTAVVPARAARGNTAESVRPVPVLIRALRSGGHRVAAARLRTSRKRSAKHPAVAGQRPR